jgi:hypothetical protein
MILNYEEHEYKFSHFLLMKFERKIIPTYSLDIKTRLNKGVSFFVYTFCTNAIMGNLSSNRGRTHQI